MTYLRRIKYHCYWISIFDSDYQTKHQNEVYKILTQDMEADKKGNYAKRYLMVFSDPKHQNEVYRYFVSDKKGYYAKDIHSYV